MASQPPVQPAVGWHAHGMDEALRRSLRAIDPGDAESRARALMARVRAGAIDEDRLVIAAQAGDPTARGVVDELRGVCACGGAAGHAQGCPVSEREAASGRVGVRIPTQIDAWVRHLHPVQIVECRVILALHPLLPASVAAGDRQVELEARLDELEVRIRDWLFAPDHPRAVQVDRVSEELQRRWHRLRRDLPLPPGGRAVESARYRLLRLAAETTIYAPDLRGILARLAPIVLELPPEAAREAISQVLLRWALGEEQAPRADAELPFSTGTGLASWRLMQRLKREALAHHMGISVEDLARLERSEQPLAPAERARCLNALRSLASVLRG